MQNNAIGRRCRSNSTPAFVVVSCVLSILWQAASASSQEGTLTPPTINPNDRLGGASIFGEMERLPTVAEGRMTLPPIRAATIDVAAIGNGSTPLEFRSAEDTPVVDLPESGMERDSSWVSTDYQFAAANTFSHPRYFEDRMLERHGHERYPLLQPVVSGARFFVTFPMLPYLMTVSPPCECQSELGYFRAGSCVYPYIQRPPYQRDAVIVEAAAISGAAIALP